MDELQKKAVDDLFEGYRQGTVSKSELMQSADEMQNDTLYNDPETWIYIERKLESVPGFLSFPKEQGV